MMELIVNPSRSEWRGLCRRNIPEDDPEVTSAVGNIVETVAREGDKALRRFAHEFDNSTLVDFKMTGEEIDRAASRVSANVKEAIERAASNIASFHRAQLMTPIEVETTAGVRCLQRQVPLKRVGLYIPGGRAPLFSTVLMLGVPASIAGCRKVALFTPCGVSGDIAPEIALAARVCGIKEIYRIGGAQAVAAMAYGTESIEPVDKIFGPGNRYVTKAKQLVSSVTAIDMPAGPSEVMVMADSTAEPSFVAADLLSQAEHGPDSQAVLVTDSERFGRAVMAEVNRQKMALSRGEMIAKSLAGSRIVILSNRQDMTDFANIYASEHLIIAMERPWEVANRIDSAGSIFIGNYSCESAGDYASGTNHTLPTAGWARSMSGVNIDSFMKKITYQQITPEGLHNLSSTIIAMAKAEGLDAHAAAVEIRLNK